MRKLGHIPEYLLLGLSAGFAFRKWWKAGILCVGVSFLDEIVKGLLSGREFDFVDMRFDFVGDVIGIGILCIVIRKNVIK